MPAPQRKPLLIVLNNAPVLLFIGIFLGFGLLSDKFLQPRNLINILVQASSLAIVAIGMTFVLLTAGVDLSVGAIMYVSAAVAGKLTLQGVPLFWAVLVIIGVSLVYGALNALIITRFKIMAFIATLATLYLGRGLGLW